MLCSTRVYINIRINYHICPIAYISRYCFAEKRKETKEYNKMDISVYSTRWNEGNYLISWWINVVYVNYNMLFFHTIVDCIHAFVYTDAVHVCMWQCLFCQSVMPMRLCMELFDGLPVRNRLWCVSERVFSHNNTINYINRYLLFTICTHNTANEAHNVYEIQHNSEALHQPSEWMSVQESCY